MLHHNSDVQWPSRHSKTEALPDLRPRRALAPAAPAAPAPDPEEGAMLVREVLSKAYLIDDFNPKWLFSQRTSLTYTTPVQK